jgi:CubicO group peptidase (beta-lactamase class C family)
MTKEILSKLLVLFFLLFTISNLEAQTNNDLYKDIISSADNFFITKMDSTNVVGLSAAIIVNDSMIWSNGFGYSDKKNKVQMTVNTIVNIGSITKTITSLSVMQLQEKGLLDINQPLTTYLPEFKPKTRGIKLGRVTIKSMLTHTSGIQSDIWKNSDLASGNYTDVLGFINDTYITYPPGMTGLYSNAGYNILGNLIKVVSKQDYTDYTRQHIFAPLGMNKTGFATDNLKNRAKIYLGGKEVKEYELRDIASGGIYTNIVDFAGITFRKLK